MEKFTLAGNTALRYDDSGEGRPLLLLHGYLESLEVWDEFSGLLRKSGYRTIAFDLPGHGVSEVLSECHTMEFLAETAYGLLQKIGVDRCTVVGHSMGGYVALALAATHPEVLDGLVLFHSTPDPDSDEKKELRRREIEVIRAGRKELLARTTPPKGFAPENRRRLAEQIEALSLQVMLTEDEGIVALVCGMMARADRNEMLHRLEVPRLFIFGRHDQYIPVEVAEAVAARHPEAQVAWLEHSGHQGFLEEPASAIGIIRNFAPPFPPAGPVTC